ncbi:MAG TPA: rod shape-determining protein RodA [Thiotrichales bacterium]|nr:rod shape-determining protein RodA [Thiotrichales bacterium]
MTLIDTPQQQLAKWRFYIDPWLLLGILALATLGSSVVYSASDGDLAFVEAHLSKLILAMVIMVIAAQIPLNWYRQFSVPLYLVGLALLLAVMFFGEISKGAQRWLDFGVFRFQPSEIMKLAMPATIAWLLAKQSLPPNWSQLGIALLILLIPVALIAKQPDLGTAILVVVSGGAVIFFAGLSWKLIAAIITFIAVSAPVAWNFLHDYQQKRVLMFLDPESDPLGAGYHIIQSKIAIGSGGLEGKGWRNGSQTQLDFLPESHTDFVFSVLAEEWGLLGVSLLLTLYAFVILRGLYIAWYARDSFGQLMAGAITMSFFIYVFINIGMVSGLLPVVGVPLPIISYGGTSLVTLMLGFGILMSIHAEHKRQAKRHHQS